MTSVLEQQNGKIFKSCVVNKTVSPDSKDQQLLSSSLQDVRPVSSCFEGKVFGFPSMRCSVLCYLKPPPEDLTCHQCKVLVPILWAASCKHCFCAYCVEDAIDPLRVGMFVCPIDKTETLEEELKQMQFQWENISWLTTTCPKSPCLCSFEGRLDELQGHLDSECNWNLIKCSSCQEEIPWKQHLNHVHEEEERPFRCSRCEKKLTPSRLTNHDGECEKRLVVCSFCGKFDVPKAQMRHHLEKTCKKTPKPCKLSVFGCTFQGKYREMAQHEILQTHLELIVNFSQRLGEDMNRLQATVCETRQENIDLQTVVNSLQEEVSSLTQERNSLKEEVTLLRERVQSSQENTEKALASLKEQEEHLEETRALSWANNRFVWNITPFRELQQRQSDGEIRRLVSPSFYTSIPGYKLRLQADLCGYGPSKGEYLSLFVQVQRGRFDNIIDWPCKLEQVLRINDQTGRGLHYDKVHAFRNVAPQYRHLLAKPINERNLPLGFYNMLSLQQIFDEANGHLRNDTMIITWKGKS